MKYLGTFVTAYKVDMLVW